MRGHAPFTDEQRARIKALTAELMVIAHETTIANRDPEMCGCEYCLTVDQREAALQMVFIHLFEGRPMENGWMVPDEDMKVMASTLSQFTAGAMLRLSSAIPPPAILTAICQRLAEASDSYEPPRPGKAH